MTLSRTLHDAAGDAPELDLAAVHRRAADRRRRRGRATMAAGVLTVAALAGLVGVAAAGDPPQRERAFGTVVSGGSGQASSDDEPTTTAPSTDPTDSTVPPSTVEPTPSTEAPPSTEPPTAQPPTTQPPTTRPAPAQLVLQGTYAGDGGYVFGDPRCPDMAGSFTFAADLGAHGAWTLRQENCGEVVGEQWHGVGTWTLDGPSGDIRGTYEVWAPMGTSGVPYDMVVTGGTGTLAGASGTCAVTIEITPPGSLTQHQEGTIDCLVDVPSSADASASGDDRGPVSEVG